MRLFETIPPSVPLLTVAVVLVALLYGPGGVLAFAACWALVDLGHRLDSYGVRDGD